MKKIDDVTLLTIAVILFIGFVAFLFKDYNRYELVPMGESDAPYVIDKHTGKVWQARFNKLIFNPENSN